MILNLERKSLKDFAIQIKTFFSVLPRQLLRKKEMSKLVKDAKELKRIYSIKYPKLKVYGENQTSCVSCGLCEKACPTDALKVKPVQKTDQINVFNGDAPKAFHLDLQTCIQCGICKLVCGVDAIELTGEYSGESIDLMGEFNHQIAESSKGLENLVEKVDGQTPILE